MKNLLRLPDKLAVTVTKTMTVFEAVRVMLAARVGAAAVVEAGRLQGIFTERDIMERVVLDRRNPETTLVSEIMTANVTTIPAGTDPNEAVGMMIDEHFRHLPVVSAEGEVLGMLSTRHIMREHIKELQQSVEALTNYISADGMGG
jgi:CBS domain-containing protein